MKILASVVTEVDRFTLVENEDGALSVPQAQAADPFKFFSIIAVTRLNDVAKAKNRYESDELKIRIEKTENSFRAALVDEKNSVIFSATITVYESDNQKLEVLLNRLPEIFCKMKNFA